MQTAKVIKGFKDKHTGKLYGPGQEYRSKNSDRVQELADMGYLELPTVEGVRPDDAEPGIQIDGLGLPPIEE